MKITYDPEIQGRELSETEIKRLIALKPAQNSFSVDEPELTDELIQRMKLSKRPLSFLKTGVQ